MSDPTRPLRGAMPNPLDATALLEAQGRLFAAFARSGQIVAEAARGCAERQADLASAALRGLLAAGPLGGAPSAGDPLQDRATRPSALLERIGQEVGRMQRIVVEAQQAVLAELGRAFETTPAARREAAPAPAAPAPAAPAPAAAAPTSPVSTAPAATAPAQAALGEAALGEAAAVTTVGEPATAASPAAPAPGEAAVEPPVPGPVEPARPRRTRKVAAQG